MEIIKSKDNNKIKYIRSLSSKKGREEAQAFTVEGIKFVNEAIKEKAHIINILFCESSYNKTNEVKELYGYALEMGLDVFICDEKVFDSVADTISAQGVLAVIKKNEYKNNLDDYKFTIMCDRIQDPGNLGTIIRTADAFGPAAVLLNKGCVDVYNPKVVRASAGAIFRVPLIFVESDIDTINDLKSKDFNVIATVVDSQYSFDNINESEKICVVIGNEGQGISSEIVESCSMSITIKMTGRSESLNASIAAGISIYEIRKKLLS